MLPAMKDQPLPVLCCFLGGLAKSKSGERRLDQGWFRPLWRAAPVPGFRLFGRSQANVKVTVAVVDP
jgi:hypothetical protein